MIKAGQKPACMLTKTAKAIKTNPIHKRNFTKIFNHFIPEKLGDKDN
jgi:hypothetical protein